MFSNELQHKQTIVETNKGIWVSREILQMDLTPSEKLVYALLCQLSQMEKKAAYITNKQVSQITGIAETTVKNKIKPELRKLGLLQTVGIYNNVKHLKGDTKGTPQDMHLKGDGDMHLKGDRGCTKKVTQNNNEILQENIKVTYLLRDSNQSDPDRVNNLTSNLELYVEDNIPDVPEWMDELPVTEPWEQYTEDIQGEAMQETDNNTFQADERENDPVTDKVNNNFITDTQKMTVQERKEKQTELSRKWENFKTQVPQMHRADAEMYFSRFLSKVEQYYTGTHINIIQERFIREFNDLKPLADWNEEQAKQDVENWIGQGFNPETIKRYLKQKYGESHDEFVMAQWKQHHSRPIELNPEYVKNPNAPYVLPF